jgi:hypothetical protein
VATDGSLPHVQPAPSLSEQFGLHCAVVRHLTRGFPYKVRCVAVLQRCCTVRRRRYLHAGCADSVERMPAIERPPLHYPLHARPVSGNSAWVQVVAFKAYLRTNTGNHKAVTARTAPQYFGPVPPGEKSPRCVTPTKPGRVAGGVWQCAIVYHRVMSCLCFPRPLLYILNRMHLPGSNQQTSAFAAASGRATSDIVVSCRGGFYGASDLYDLTPYSAQPEKYVRTELQPRGTGRGWRAAVYPKAIGTMHFKWHSGVLQRYYACCAACIMRRHHKMCTRTLHAFWSLPMPQRARWSATHCSAQERLQHYRGDVSSGMPRYQHFVESERILAMLQNGSLPIKVRPLPANLPSLARRAWRSACS